MQAQMLAPAAVLVLWTVIVLVWLMVVRMPAMKKARPQLKNLAYGGRGQDMESLMPDKPRWVSHNYTHLMEQPTIFYPAVVILAVMGASTFDVLIAWIYVAFRIVHSIWQNTVNKVSIRALLFLISSLAMIVLAIRAVMATLFHDPGAY